MPNEIEGNRLVVLLALSGLVSGLLTSALMYPKQEAGLASGTTFGLFLTFSLAISGILDSFLRALRLIVVVASAYFLAYMTTYGAQLTVPGIVPEAEQWSMGHTEPASPIALFLGGLVGGAIVFGEMTSLLRNGISTRTRLLKVLQGAIVGGVLGVAGWALRSSVGLAVWSLLHLFGLTPPWELSPRQSFDNNYDYGQTSRMYSLYVVWQAGVAMAVGIMLRRHPFKETTSQTTSRVA